MPDVSKDLMVLLQYLAPGFLVAWICFGLTSHQKPSQFERVVQALIYALFVRLFSDAIRGIFLFFGQWHSLGTWGENADVLTSLVSALSLGFTFAYFVHSDQLHALLRKLGVSSKSSHPSEWCEAFTRRKDWVIVHLKDERRLLGWPAIWAPDPSKGHLLIDEGGWLHDNTSTNGDNSSPEALIIVDSNDQLKSYLIDVADIKWIEFVPTVRG